MKLLLLKTLSVLTALIFSTQYAQAQQSLSLEDAIQTALQNNEHIKAGALDVDYYRAVKRTASDAGKFSAVWMHGQYNSVYQDNNVTLTQTIPFPTVMTSQAKLGTQQIIGAQQNLLASKNEIVFEVKSGYQKLLYFIAQRKLLISQDSLFSDFARASSLRFKTGESNLLEKATAETQSMEAKNLLAQNESDILIQQTQLMSLMKVSSPFTISASLKRDTPDTSNSSPLNNPRLLALRQEAVIGGQLKRTEQNKLLPDLQFGYFNQSLTGVQNISGQDIYYGSSRRFQGFQLGIAFPLWAAPQAARIKAQGYREEELKKNASYFETTLSAQYAGAIQEFQKNSLTLDYYEKDALKNADLILSQARKSFTGGEIGYIEYLQSIKTALGIKSNYLAALSQHNQSAARIEFLIGNITTTQP